jgi:integrase/recombinase XerC
MSDNNEQALRRHPSRRRPQLELVGAGEPPELGAVLSDYLAHLERAPLSPNTRRSYGFQARRFFGWLADRGNRGADALSASGRDYAVRDYRSELKDRRLAPASINSALAGLDNLYRFLRLDPPRVRREPLPASAPRALTDEELRRLLRAAEARGEPRDRAIVALMALAGLRLAEVAGLDVDDIALSARRGMVTVRHGKGDVGRSVPLGTEARSLVAAWLRIRPNVSSQALLVGSAGSRLTPRGLDRVVRRISTAAGLSMSPHVLRHTFVTRLVRSGKDLVIVAELAGHRSLETTRRYSLPTEADRVEAVEAAATEY